MMPQRGSQRGRGRGRYRRGYTPPPFPQAPNENSFQSTRPAKLPPAEIPLTIPQLSVEETVEEIPKQQEFGQDISNKTPETDVLNSSGIELKYNLQHQPLLPLRTSEGKLGTKVKLISNCYPVMLPSGNVYHYDVTITTSCPEKEVEKSYKRLSTKLNRKVINLMLGVREEFRGLYAAYDGRKNLYTRHVLKCEKFPLKCEIQMPDDNEAANMIYEIEVKPVKKKETESCAINLDTIHAYITKNATVIPEEAIMAVETIMSNSSCLKYIPIGRSFFYPPDVRNMQPLGEAKDIWFGFHQSLRLGQFKPIVNLDVTATTFYKKGPILELVASLLKTSVDNLRRIPHLSTADILRLSKELQGVQVEANHFKEYKRKYKIIRLTGQSASKLEFSFIKNDAQRTITVKKHFREQYGLDLKFPQLPCLQVCPEKRNVFIPLEVCDVIEGQHSAKKLDDIQKAKMIKFTARKPEIRFQEIEDNLKRVNYAEDPYMKEFEITVDPKPLLPTGRVIQSPGLKYMDEEIVRPKDGSWNMIGKEFLISVKIESWVMLSFANEQYCHWGILNRFSNLLCNISKKIGIDIERPSLIDVIGPKQVNIPDILQLMKNKYKANLVVIVLPDEKNKLLYGEIKQAAEIKLGLVTQCVRVVNVVEKASASLISNLCQKINSKLGGVNTSLIEGERPAIFERSFIVIGADVNHSHPKSKNVEEKKEGNKSKQTKEKNEGKSISIAAAVGSLDDHPYRYAATVRAQTNPTDEKRVIEIILDLEKMVLDLLRAYYRNNQGRKPERIIFYRDGVSEGELAKVKDHEVKCIRKACRKLGADYAPKITFIVVQKRHHVRFMPKDSRDGVGKMKNVAPGTTVDNTVVHPQHFDFFLCSHFGLQGTSRPGLYTVIEDDNDLTADELQKLTYYLCYTFARCTKSISIPVPVQYAHLAAYRARRHLDFKLKELNLGPDSPIPSSLFLSDVLSSFEVVDQLKDSMYFV